MRSVAPTGQAREGPGGHTAQDITLHSRLVNSISLANDPSGLTFYIAQPEAVYSAASLVRRHLGFLLTSFLRYRFEITAYGGLSRIVCL